MIGMVRSPFVVVVEPRCGDPASVRCGYLVHGGVEITARQSVDARDDLGLNEEDERSDRRVVQEVDRLAPFIKEKQCPVV
ncbi:hypothetical protein [Streptomyces californicus]|uniref:hypothetical protein n=1 Tax=Streptomyces californicus TaxID=67351 RepID=UPI00379BECD2